MKILHIGNLKSGIDTYVRNTVAWAGDDFEFVIVSGADDGSEPYMRHGQPLRQYVIGMYRRLNPWKDAKAVILIAFLYGYLFERVNCNVVRYCRRGAYLKAFSSSVMLRILGCMMISSGSFSIYLFFLPIIFIYLLAKSVDRSMEIIGKVRIIHKP